MHAFRRTLLGAVAFGTMLIPAGLNAHHRGDARRAGARRCFGIAGLFARRDSIG